MKIGRNFKKFAGLISSLIMVFSMMPLITFASNEIDLGVQNDAFVMRLVNEGGIWNKNVGGTLTQIDESAVRVVSTSADSGTIRIDSDTFFSNEDSIEYNLGSFKVRWVSNGSNFREQEVYVKCLTLKFPENLAKYDTRALSGTGNEENWRILGVEPDSVNLTLDDTGVNSIIEFAFAANRLPSWTDSVANPEGLFQFGTPASKSNQLTLQNTTNPASNRTFLLDTMNLDQYYNENYFVNVNARFYGMEEGPSIRGRRIPRQDFYEVDIYFNDDVTYRFDEGEYDKNIGRFRSRPESEFPEYGLSLDAGPIIFDNNTRGHWFGFNGTQNMILVINKSTRAVAYETNFEGTPGLTGTFFNGDIQDAFANEVYNGFTLIQHNEGTEILSALEDHASVRTQNPFGGERANNGGNGTLNAIYVDDDTQVANVSGRAIYYSFSGKVTSLSEADQKIGTITVKIVPSVD